MEDPELATRELTITWSGDGYPVSVHPSDAVSDIKRRLGDLTRVIPKRQKLMGLKNVNGKPATDETLVSELLIKDGMKVMMLGTPEDVIEATNEQAAAAGEVHDDFQIPEDDFVHLDPADDPEVLAKLQRRLDSVEVKILNAPRPGKKLLVLDIDYTIFDLGSSSERPEHLARPHLHTFMRACYEHYDLVIWSATSMKWVETKMRALGVLTNEHYKITFMLDFKAMVTIHTEARGVFDCKPLAFIWRKFPEFYNGTNTIMLDDLRRNYIMNKQQGLVIRPYTKCHKNHAVDRELVHLKWYLLYIARLESLESLDHKAWERYLRKHISDADSAARQADLANP